MSESLYARCQRICGTDDKSCFIHNAKQVSCLADMHVNKMYGLSAVLEMIKADGVSESSEELLDESFQITDDLINWVKYLQISSDVNKGLATDDPERRDSIRYYGLSSLASITLNTDFGHGMQPTDMVNFSQKGLQIVTKLSVKVGDTFKGEMHSEQHAKSVTFTATVKYFAKHDYETIIGASIDEIDHSGNFNFFRSIMNLLEDSALNR